MQISATIIALNEEGRIARAIASLGVADEIIVVDSGSADATLEVARRAGARVFSHAWAGYAAQKNFAAAQAQYPWILSLDADEALSPALEAEIERVKISGPGETAGFAMPRLARYQGRWIHHCGWYPDFKLRLYDRRRGGWVGDFVHEQVKVDGPVKQMRGDIHHFTCDSFAEHFRTLDRYTTLAAQDARHRGSGWILPGLIAGPPWKAFETYILKQGFRDGFPGFIISGMAGLYVYLKYAKLWQMKHGAASNDSIKAEPSAAPERQHSSRR
jgi:glycosyltransferase involved in cell wall biosynthesis